MTIHEAIFKAGARLRNPKLFESADRLRKTDFAAQDEYQHIQAEKLLSVFDFHKKNSAYYKEILPERIRDPHEVLANLPILTKAELVANQEVMQCYKNCGKSFFAETSGTSGTPFSFRKDLIWDTNHRASIIRSYWWHNVQPWDRNGYFWGYSFSRSEKAKTELLDSLQNRFRVFSYNKTELEAFLTKMKKASYIHGYSSMIYEVAKMAKELGFGPDDFRHLKMIKGTSEKIYDFYHKPVLEVFGKKIISEYGSAEGGIHAFECDHGNMHVNEENVILEEIEGKAVITNLNAYSLPIYRYQLGDAISIDSTSNCSCGRKSKIVSEVLGRVGKKIIGKSQTYPSLTLYYIFKNIAITKGLNIQYQGFQDTPGELELRFANSLSIQETAWITEQCEVYFKNDLQVTFVDSFNLHDRKSKLKDFVTFLDK